MNHQPPGPLKLRRATHADVMALDRLIERATRILGARHYSPSQIESGLRHVFHVDLDLIGEGTQFLAELDGKLVGAGGWSRQHRLFLGELAAATPPPEPAVAARTARLRMFFVDPDHARQGIARQLFSVCAADARAAGFNRFELLATLPGEPLYRALGFQVDQRVEATLPDGVVLSGVLMSLDLASPVSGQP